MSMDRRTCLKRLAGLGGASLLGSASQALAHETFSGNPDRFGVLVDLSVCVGCRKCEWACNNANLPEKKPIEYFEDESVFSEVRRMHADTFTVVNRFDNPRDPEKPVYVKRQCMHCDEPACASACFVKAFIKTPEGPVVHDASLCMGCRYCMLACPFDVPAYQYDDAFTPEVTKCTFCFEKVSDGGVPACVKVCPVEALTFGKRKELIDVAHEKIRANPEQYVNHVYGETEVGGTSWMYISPVPFEELGFRTDLGTTPIPQYSRGFLTMVSLVLVTWPAFCMGAYTFSKRREEVAKAESTEKISEEEQS
jgi:Fe-S-cluster-containing dehydrogenase component